MVVVSRVRPVARTVAVTFASTTTAPVGSVTRPAILPVGSAPVRVPARQSSSPGVRHAARDRDTVRRNKFQKRLRCIETPFLYFATREKGRSPPLAVLHGGLVERANAALLYRTRPLMVKERTRSVKA